MRTLCLLQALLLALALAGCGFSGPSGEKIREDAYNEGYEDGLRDGEVKGYDRGYGAGYDDGYEAGKRDAKSTTPTVVAAAAPAFGSSGEPRDYVLNTNTHKFHHPSCKSVLQMNAKNKKTIHATREEVIDMGYSPCGNCDP